MQIEEITKKYSSKLGYLDIEVIIAHSLDKPREFVLAHPEYSVTSNQQSVISRLVNRRIKGEPVAYLVGHKEFYGLDFIVNKHTLVPRPETEILVDSVIKEQRTANNKNTVIIDMGTGSGNIIISLAHTIGISGDDIVKCFATDISKTALAVAKKNAKIHNTDKKITFLSGNLLTPLLKNKKLNDLKNNKLVIAANLPYGWNAWKNNCSMDTIGLRYEPSIALFTGKRGLELYEKLFKQTNILIKNFESIVLLCELDPRQKNDFGKLAKKIFPKAKISFEKDLAKKWRICKINV